MDAIVLSTALTALLANIGLGGGIFEHGVIDHAWPRKPEIVQPRKGGISRVRFWIPAHSAFELVLLVTLYLGWGHGDVRKALLLALAAHLAMRLWSAFDMIPKAIAFEKAEAVDEAAARLDEAKPDAVSAGTPHQRRCIGGFQRRLWPEAGLSPSASQTSVREGR